MNSQQLDNLKDFVNHFPLRLAGVEYYDINVECGCVVGEMLMDLGINENSLICLGNYVDDWNIDVKTDTELVDSSLNLNTYLASKMLVEKFGLTPSEFKLLQNFNDKYTHTPEERAEHVKEYMNNIIRLKENELEEMDFLR